MQSSPEEYIEAYDHIKIATYCFSVPSLALWTGLFARVLISKDRDKLNGLIIICILMIVTQAAGLALWQLSYTYVDRFFTGHLKHFRHALWITQACTFTTTTAFNLAHWILAFSYFALSHRLELIAKGLPESTHNCRLNTFNVVVCLFNVAVPAIAWAYQMKGE